MANPTAAQTERLVDLGYSRLEVQSWTPELLVAVLRFNTPAVSTLSVEEKTALQTYVSNPWYRVDTSTGELEDTAFSNVVSQTEEFIESTSETLAPVGEFLAGIGSKTFVVALAALGVLLAIRK